MYLYDTVQEGRMLFRLLIWTCCIRDVLKGCREQICRCPDNDGPYRCISDLAANEKRMCSSGRYAIIWPYPEDAQYRIAYNVAGYIAPMGEAEIRCAMEETLRDLSEEGLLPGMDGADAEAVKARADSLSALIRAQRIAETGRIPGASKQQKTEPEAERRILILSGSLEGLEGDGAERVRYGLQVMSLIPTMRHILAFLHGLGDKRASRLTDAWKQECRSRLKTLQLDPPPGEIMTLDIYDNQQNSLTLLLHAMRIRQHAMQEERFIHVPNELLSCHPATAVLACICHRMTVQRCGQEGPNPGKFFPVFLGLKSLGIYGRSTVHEKQLVQDAKACMKTDGILEVVTRSGVSQMRLTDAGWACFQRMKRENAVALASAEDGEAAIPEEALRRIEEGAPVRLADEGNRLYRLVEQLRSDGGRDTKAFIRFFSGAERWNEEAFARQKHEMANVLDHQQAIAFEYREVNRDTLRNVCNGPRADGKSWMAHDALPCLLAFLFHGRDGVQLFRTSGLRDGLKEILERKTPTDLQAFVGQLRQGACCRIGFRQYEGRTDPAADDAITFVFVRQDRQQTPEGPDAPFRLARDVLLLMLTKYNGRKPMSGGQDGLKNKKGLFYDPGICWTFSEYFLRRLDEHNRAAGADTEEKGFDHPARHYKEATKLSVRLSFAMADNRLTGCEAIRETDAIMACRAARRHERYIRERMTGEAGENAYNLLVEKKKEQKLKWTDDGLTVEVELHLQRPQKRPLKDAPSGGQNTDRTNPRQVRQS